MKSIGCAVFSFVLFGTILAAQEPHYDMDLTVDPRMGTLEGTVTVSVPAGTAAQGTLYLRLLLNTMETRNPKAIPLYAGPEGFSAGYARISEVTVEGRPAEARYIPAPLAATDYNLDKAYAAVDLGAAAAGGVSVRFHYAARLPHYRSMDDFYFEDEMASRFDWFPQATSPDRLAAYQLEPFTYEARVSLPDDWDMARIGTSWSRHDGTIDVASTAAVVSFPLVFLKGYKVYRVGWLKDAKNLDVYYRPEAEDVSRLVSAYGREALEYYAERFFPLEETFVSVVENNPGSYGEAADSLVLLGDGMFGGVNRNLPGLFTRWLEKVVFHEIGHLYWGVGTPPDFLSENYLSEGLNEYSTLEYLESRHGRWDNLFAPAADLAGEAFQLLDAPYEGHSWISRKFYSIVKNRMAGWDEPLSSPAKDKILNAGQTVSYDKPVFVLSMLGRFVGRDLFERALKDYLLAYRHQPVSSATLESLLEEKTGKDLKGFFDAFVYGTKSVDDELSGTLNRPTTEGYRSTFTVKDKGDSGIFIPTTLTVFYEDGTTGEIAVDSPGDYVVESAASVRYAGVDKDAENLDYDRKNNFLPRGFAFSTSPECWLIDGAADTLSPFLSPYLQTDPTGRLDLGLGLKLSDSLHYAVDLSPIVSVPGGAIPTSLDQVGLGAGLFATANLTGNLIASLNATYLVPALIPYTGITLTRNFQIDQDVGYTGRYFFPVFSLSVAGALLDYDFASPASWYLSAGASLSFNNVQKTGTEAVLSDSVDWSASSGAFEDRVSLDAAQAVPLLRRLLFGVELKGSGNFGTLTHFGGSNAALGIDSTGEVRYTYGASALAFLGVPLWNAMDAQVLNAFVIQSLNLALVYEAGTAWNDPAGIAAKLQQAAGIELLPLFRFLQDASIGLAFRVAFDVNAIAAAPGAPESWIPRISLDASILPSLFSASASY